MAAKQLKILAVYEHQDALLMVKSITETMNVELRSCKSAYAQSTLKEENIDFVLIDSKVHDPSAEVLLKELLKDYPGLFVAMMSDDPTDPQIERCLKMGAKLGLIRPFRKDDIAVAAQQAESSFFYKRELLILEQKLLAAQGEEKKTLEEKIKRLKMVVEDIKTTQEKKAA